MGRPIKNIFPLYSTGFICNVQEMTISSIDALKEIKFDECIDLEQSRAVEPTNFDSVDISRLFTSISSTICTSGVHASPAQNSITLPENQVEAESVMSRSCTLGHQPKSA
jgi:hypothetical protein